MRRQNFFAFLANTAAALLSSDRFQVKASGHFSRYSHDLHFALTVVGIGSRSSRQYPIAHYLLDDEGHFEEFRFDQRWRMAEARIFDQKVGRWDMRGVYWAATESSKRPGTEDYTHIVSSATPPKKRLDHILVSEQFEVTECDLWNGVDGSIDGLSVSDHAPVFTRLELN